MPLAKVKLLTHDKSSGIESLIAAYFAAHPDLSSEPVSFVSGAMRADDGDTVMVTAIAHGGLRRPSGTAPSQRLIVQMQKIENAQAAVDAALASAVHASTTADTTVSNQITVTTPFFFDSEDTGRSLKIGTRTVAISSITDEKTVTYTGTALPSSAAVTCDMLGAEYVDQVSLVVRKQGANETHVTVIANMEGAGEDALAAAMAKALKTDFSFFHCYVRSLGNDDTGDGSVANPVRSMQRVCDAIVNAGEISKVLFGNIVCHHGRGTFEGGFALNPVRAGSALYVEFVADESDPILNFSVTAPLTPAPNTAKPGDNLASHFDIPAPVHAATIGPGTHWLNFPTAFGVDPDQIWEYGVLVDEENHTATNIRVVSRYDTWNGQAELREIDTFITPPGDSRNLTFINNNDASSIRIFLTGFMVRPAAGVVGQVFLTTRGVDFYPSTLQSVAWTMNGDDATGLDTAFDIDADSYQQIVGGASSYFVGLWRCPPRMAGSSGEFSVAGSLRSAGPDDGGAAMFIGGLTGGRAPSHNGYELEGLDQRAGFIVVEGANVRLGDHYPNSVKDATSVVQVQKGGRVEVVNVSGRTAGVPFLFQEDGIVHGDGLWATRARVDNQANPGQEVMVDDVVMSAVRVAGEGSRSNGPINAELTTTDATVTEAMRVRMNVDNSVKTLLVTASAVDAAGVAAYSRRFLCRRASGVSTVFAQTPVADNVQGLGAGTDITATISGTDVLINVKGVAATTIKWHVRVQVQDRR